MTGDSIMIADPALPFGDVNVLVLTDVHSWVASHRRQEPFYNADFGDILSFYERLKAYCTEMEMDLWFVSNGDWAHGTGMAGPGDATGFLPILEKMPWDAVNCGNHELYENAKVETMIRPGGFVDWFGDRYLTANILRANDPEKSPLGNHYKVLQGKYSNLLTFGFLYNMNDSCDLIEVAPVKEVVNAQWFVDALESESYDAILILAHMDLVDPLVDVIREAIRKVVGPDMPIQFITGHTHYRGSVKLDDASTSFEAGRYLDTLGFVSFPTMSTLLLTRENSTESSFHSVFLDPNMAALGDTLKMPDFVTPNGKELSEFIVKTQQKMGLLEEIGCAPMEYFIDAPLDDKHSLFGLYRDEVIPKMFFSQENTEDITSIMFLPKESFRYDLKAFSTLLVDDLWAVAPFNDTVTFMGSFSGRTIHKLNDTVNSNLGMESRSPIPNYILIGDISGEDKTFKLYTHEFGSGKIADALREIDPNSSIQPANTAYTSTLLWLSFVVANWPCTGSVGSLPDWVPTPEHVTKKIGREDNDMTKSMVTIVLIVLVFLVTCAIAMCCRFWVRYFFYVHQPILQHEINTFKDDLSLDDTEEYPKTSSDMDDFTDEDHEFL